MVRSRTEHGRDEKACKGYREPEETGNMRSVPGWTGEVLGLSGVPKRISPCLHGEAIRWPLHLDLQGVARWLESESLGKPDWRVHAELLEWLNDPELERRSGHIRHSRLKAGRDVLWSEGTREDTPERLPEGVPPFGASVAVLLSQIRVPYLETVSLRLNETVGKSWAATWPVDAVVSMA
jgi:hypothetical protein